MSRFILNIREKHVIIYDMEESMDILKCKNDEAPNLCDFTKAVDILNKIHLLSYDKAYDNGEEKGYAKGFDEGKWEAEIETRCCCGECD